MTHSEDLARIVDGSLNRDAVLDASSHGFLAKNVVPLCSKGGSDLCMQMVLYSNQDCICKPLSNGADGLCRRCEEILPSVKYEGPVDLVQVRKMLASVGTRLGNGNDLAALWRT